MTIALEGLERPTEILPFLWMGPKPPEGHFLADLGFRHLVLCAVEHQPPASRFPGVRKVNHCPLDDSRPVPPTPEEWRIACLHATAAAIDANAGRKVIVTCQQGINRSGLVTALAAALILNCSGEAAVELVRTMRPGALRKPQFRDFIAEHVRPRKGHLTALLLSGR